MNFSWNNFDWRRMAAVLASLSIFTSTPPRASRTWAQSAAEEPVGRDEGGRTVTPVNQVVTPYGRQVDLPRMRPQTVALSPDGRLLVASGKTSELAAIDPASARLTSRIPFPSEEGDRLPSAAVSSQILRPDRESQVSFTGLVFSPAGDRLYLSNVEGLIEVFRVADGTLEPAEFWPLPPARAPRREAEIPAGLAVSPDGRRLYVCGNLSNTLLELDAADGKTLRSFPVGVAPYDVALLGNKAYVSNWGGRRPGSSDLTGPAGRGTTVRVDPVRHIASEGSVSVVDLQGGAATKELMTGLHASGLAICPTDPLVVCCNAASDHLTVIDARRDEAVATIWTKSSPAELLGAAPNAAAFSPDGRRLYVANGSQNAVAAINFEAADPRRSRLAGLIPVGWYPGAILYDGGRQQIVTANLKGMSPAPTPHDELDAEGFNSHQHYGSVTIASPPKDPQELGRLSEQVAANLRAPRLAAALLPPRADQPPRPVPERIGEPSLIQHVVYVIKENRTYDQVLGDLPQGNGDPRLCIFGREATPNQHRLAEEFVLLDNAYCSGILSADGHQWSTTAFSTDYMEKSFAGFPRSYPDGMGVDEDDALAYAPSGFIWDNALKHGKSVRNYGEFMGPSVRWKDPSRRGEPDFRACFDAWQNHRDDVVFASWPSVESLRAISPSGYVGWNMAVPDQWRVDFILRELADFERRGEFPALTIVCLPQDHTSGTDPGAPTPAACIADNDLAFGRLVAGLSRSNFWPRMAIFAIEDDPQAGWDHVSGYRTTAYCISPYAKRHAVVSTQYNTTSLLRTMEQILGLPPMNQFDASATPMFDCFQSEPNLAPFEPLDATMALDELNPDSTAISDPQLRRDAMASAKIDFAHVDRAPEDLLNRILWRAARGTGEPYPEWAITFGADDDDEDDDGDDAPNDTAPRD